ncbi:hypothetical protein LA080_000383 [Diaporthe eres]|nr:hypothetical protein LA080_000383 [Diaporthe eres]
MDTPDLYLRKLKQLLLTLQADDLQHEDLNLVGSMEQTSQQLRLNFESTGGYSSSQGAQTPPITLDKMPGRGIGVIATHLIPAGSIILKEKSIMTVPEPLNKAILPDFITKLVDHYTKLPFAVRRQLLGLHAYTRPAQDKAIRDFLDDGSGDFNLTEQQIDFVVRLHSIFATNSFETTQSTRSLYLGASRANHSCIPNCDYDHTLEGSLTAITVCSSRDIRNANVMSLKDVDEVLRRSTRRAQIAEMLGDNYNMFREHLLSARLCERKWLLTGDEKHVKSWIRFLELASHMASLVPPSPSAQRMKEGLADSLREARKLKSIL